MPIPSCPKGSLLYKKIFKYLMAEDIYTAVGWESMYQNDYVHDSPSRFSAKSTIYMAAGCQQKIAIYTTAVPEQFQTIYTAVVCLHKIAIYTAAIQDDIYTAAGRESMYQNGYVHDSPSRFSAISTIYTAAGCQHLIAIYTAAVPEQFQTIYTAAVCLREMAIYSAAIQEPNRLYTLLPGVYKKSLFTRQPLKSQIGYIHCCQVYT